MSDDFDDANSIGAQSRWMTETVTLHLIDGVESVVSDVTMSKHEFKMLCEMPELHGQALAELVQLRNENFRLRLALENAPSQAHFTILVEALAEIKATVDGQSSQPVTDIVAGCISEIAALKRPA